MRRPAERSEGNLAPKKVKKTKGEDAGRRAPSSAGHSSAAPSEVQPESGEAAETSARLPRDAGLPPDARFPPDARPPSETRPVPLAPRVVSSGAGARGASGLGSAGSSSPPAQAPHAHESPSAPTPGDRRTDILEVAAKLICERGYDATSIQDIAQACGLTKAGLYHHIRSKEHLLLEIMHYGMDRFEEQVLSKVLTIEDPVERLRKCMELNILLVTRGWSKEVTIILHEHATLTGEFRSQINARKKRYIRFLESSFAEAIREERFRPVHPKVAAFAFLGAVNWIYKWFRDGGGLTEEMLVREMVELFFGGLEIQKREKGNLARDMVGLLLGGFEVPKAKRNKADGEKEKKRREKNTDSGSSRKK